MTNAGSNEIDVEIDDDFGDDDDFRHPANSLFVDHLRRDLRFALSKLQDTGYRVSFDERDEHVRYVLHIGDGTSVMSLGIEEDPQLTVFLDEDYNTDVDLDERIVPNVIWNREGKFRVAQTMANDPLDVALRAIAEARRIREFDGD